MKKRLGFTVVEIIVVMSAIAILAGISVVGYGGMQRNARDKERVSDIQVIQNALEVYYDKNGRYPSRDEIARTESTSINFLNRDLNLPPTSYISPSKATEKLFREEGRPLEYVNDIWAANTPTHVHDDDVYTYAPMIGSSLCIPAGEPCTSYKLHYWVEGENRHQEVRSKYGH